MPQVRYSSLYSYICGKQQLYRCSWFASRGYYLAERSVASVFIQNRCNSAVTPFRLVSTLNKIQRIHSRIWQIETKIQCLLWPNTAASFRCSTPFLVVQRCNCMAETKQRATQFHIQYTYIIFITYLYNPIIHCPSNCLESIFNVFLWIGGRWCRTTFNFIALRDASHI